MSCTVGPYIQHKFDSRTAVVRVDTKTAERTTFFVAFGHAVRIPVRVPHWLLKKYYHCIDRHVRDVSKNNVDIKECSVLALS